MYEHDNIGGVTLNDVKYEDMVDNKRDIVYYQKDDKEKEYFGRIMVLPEDENAIYQLIIFKSDNAFNGLYGVSLGVTSKTASNDPETRNYDKQYNSFSDYIIARYVGSYNFEKKLENAIAYIKPIVESRGIATDDNGKTYYYNEPF